MRLVFTAGEQNSTAAFRTSYEFNLVPSGNVAQHAPMLKRDYYRRVLQDRLTNAIEGNPAYSLRELARDLGMAPSLLSNVINGKKRLSPDRATYVADKLALAAAAKDAFVLSTQLSAAKSADVIKEVEFRLDVALSRLLSAPLNNEDFQLLGDWTNVAIMEMTFLTDFEHTPDTIANALAISSQQAARSISYLESNGYLTRQDQLLRKTDKRMILASAGANSELRRFHKAMLSKAVEAVDYQKPKEKLIGSETLAMDSELLPRANEIIEECFQKLIVLAESSSRYESVYHVGIQLFPLTKRKYPL